MKRLIALMTALVMALLAMNAAFCEQTGGAVPGAITTPTELPVEVPEDVITTPTDLPEEPATEPEVEVEPEEPAVEPEVEVESEEPAVEPEVEVESEEPVVEPEVEVESEEPVTEPEVEVEPEEPVVEPAAEVSYRAGMVLKADSGNGLMIYDAPSGQCIATVGKGQMIEIAVPENGWVQIRWGGLVGFVSSDCVALYNVDAAPEEQIRSIRIYTNLGSETQVREGTVVCLSATLVGFEDDVYTLQWQYSPDGGSTAIDIAGANKPTYAYRLTAENFGYMYRLVVHIQDDLMTTEE